MSEFDDLIRQAAQGGVPAPAGEELEPEIPSFDGGARRPAPREVSFDDELRERRDLQGGWGA